jgi:hypothetical protein
VTGPLRRGCPGKNRSTVDHEWGFEASLMGTESGPKRLFVCRSGGHCSRAVPPEVIKGKEGGGIYDMWQIRL